MADEMDIFGELEALANHMRFETEPPFTPSLESLAGHQRERAGRLEAARARLAGGETGVEASGEAERGAEDAHLQALYRQGTLASRLADDVSSLARRVSRHSIPAPDQWLVTGRVSNANGSLAANLRVRVLDRDRKLDDLLGETLTDDDGEFSVVYHERDFAEQGENRPELYVLVEDPAGRSLYSSRDKVRFEAGRVEYFEITLPEAVPGTSGATDRASEHG